MSELQTHIKNYWNTAIARKGSTKRHERHTGLTWSNSVQR